MRPVVFLVHGMGEHKADWHKEVIKTLDEIISENGYSYFANKSVADIYDIVPLGYDEILRKEIEGIQDSSEKLRELSTFSNEISDLANWIDASDEGIKKYIWSHAMDVVLYRLHTPTRNLVRTALVEKMAQKIDHVLKTSPNTPVSLMAHSLGTIVAHDCVHLLGHHSWGGKINAFGPAHWRFKTITMLANVSRLLETDVPISESIVRPGYVGNSKSYCMSFQNYRHEFDPIPWPVSFSTEDFDSDATDNAVIRHFYQVNVHSWSHYLKNPRVHIPFLQHALGSNEVVSPAEQMKAMLGFKTWGGQFEPIQDSIDQLRLDFPEDLRAVGNAFGSSPSLKELVSGIVLMQKTYKKYELIVKKLESQK